MLEQQSLELLASLNESLECCALDPETEVQGETLEMDAVGGQHFDVAVIDEADPVEVDQLEVGRVSLDLSDVDDLVYLLHLFVTQFESSFQKQN